MWVNGDGGTYWESDGKPFLGVLMSQTGLSDPWGIDSLPGPGGWRVGIWGAGVDDEVIEQPPRWEVIGVVCADIVNGF